MQKGIFRKEGEYWTVGYRNSAFRLRDTKGLAYLAHLLRHPGIEFNVLDLAGGIAGEREDETSESAHGLPRGEEDLEKAGIRIASLGDAGDMLQTAASRVVNQFAYEPYGARQNVVFSRPLERRKCDHIKPRTARNVPPSVPIKWSDRPMRRLTMNGITKPDIRPLTSVSSPPPVSKAVVRD
jgi:hypothetical protein